MTFDSYFDYKFDFPDPDERPLKEPPVEPKKPIHAPNDPDEPTEIPPGTYPFKDRAGV
ncbi:MAG: hypothetical protein JNN05_06180 [Candidatus Omnitrophica bacterium]|nr:hypothetical protein [Candidatus Omnitrophota bacterium]